MKSKIGWKHESESLVNQISVTNRFWFNTDFDRVDRSGKPATNKQTRAKMFK